ncbi:tyrosine-protein phosphatase [Prauserella muralis]|uniref:Protein tyrosine phosphatase n=1 Tax=Prauserella muralis TaxID=588067 RepID=A0A2V4BE88_9PSEU|nr:tyrosine-protein phosphatase [Prauserella muralis]PXY27939.1 protein tyrosine phosphatase [Prauserella muralis]TWE22277.1 protein tyrosine/serine phosphatase [Prauserella muralis]
MLWLELEGAVNIRDVGGIPTDDGGTTEPGRLLRADNLQSLSSADISYLVDTIRLNTVVDLRTVTEVQAEGPAPLTKYAQVKHVHHSLLPEHAWGANSGDALLTRRAQEQARYPADPTCAHYLGYVEHRPDSIVGALRAIAESSGPALVHCAAGKDRTGVVVAFALSVAGARRDAIVRDYAATGERIVAIVERLRSSATYAEDVDRVTLDKHRPRPESMAAFLDQIDARYGGVHSWLAEHGFGDDDMGRLHGKLRG